MLLPLFSELLIYLSNVFKVAKKISIDLAGLCGAWKTLVLFFYISAPPPTLMNMENSVTDHRLEPQVNTGESLFN